MGGNAEEVRTSLARLLGSLLITLDALKILQMPDPIVGHGIGARAGPSPIYFRKPDSPHRLQATCLACSTQLEDPYKVHRGLRSALRYLCRWFVTCSVTVSQGTFPFFGYMSMA